MLEEINLDFPHVFGPMDYDKILTCDLLFLFDSNSCVLVFCWSWDFLLINQSNFHVYILYLISNTFGVRCVLCVCFTMPAPNTCTPHMFPLPI